MIYKTDTDELAFSDWQALTIEGLEARTFIHDLLTVDAMALAPGVANAAALLSPQGKIIALGLLCQLGEGRYRYCMPKCIIERCLNLLTFYRLRRKLTLRIDDKLQLFYGDQEFGSASFRDTRSQNLGYLSLLPYNESLERLKPDNAHDKTTYTQTRRKAGVFDMGEDFETDSLFPHDIGLDAWGALSAHKGCYLGQEVISRMIHKSRINRRPMIIKPAEAALMHSDGDILSSKGTLIGTCQGYSHNLGLAIVRLDRLAEANAQTLTLSGAPIQLERPPYAENIDGYRLLERFAVR